MAYLGRKRISGSQTLGIRQEGIQSFLGPHCGKFTQPASQWGHQEGATGVRGRIHSQMGCPAGERAGAAIRCQTISSPRDRRSGTYSHQDGKLPGSTHHAWKPPLGCRGTETTSQRLTTSHPKLEYSSLEEWCSDQTPPTYLPEGQVSPREDQGKTEVSKRCESALNFEQRPRVGTSSSFCQE